MTDDKIEIDEMSFYKNEKGEICCNRICETCVKECKQSHKAEILCCPNLEQKIDNHIQSKYVIKNTL